MEIVEIALLMKLIKDNEIDKIEDFMKSLPPQDFNSMVEILLSEIKSTNNGNERNTIAYLLGEIKCQKAAEVLIELIFEEKLKNNRGTLIFALNELECKPYIYQLLPLLYEGNYEVVMNTHMLLQKHISEIDIAEQKRCADFIRDKIGDFENILDTLYDVYENIFNQKLDD